MLYGAEKAREMGRSILPSKMTQAHQQQKQIARRHRHRAKASIRNMQWNEDGWLDCEADLTSTKAVQAEVKYLVRDRREADHLSHFYRWAEAVTADLPIEERLSYIAGFLPEGLIGFHAMTHLRNLDHFDADPTSYRNRPDYVDYRVAQLHRRYLAVEKWMQATQLIEQLIAEGRLKALNHFITAGWKPTEWKTSRTVRVFDQTNPGMLLPSINWKKYNYRVEYETHVYKGKPRVLRDSRDIESFLMDLCKQEHRNEFERVQAYLAEVLGHVAA